MDDIAKEVGVSKGAIYLYFRTKAELLIHVNDRARNEVLAGWEQLLEEGDVAEGIARSLDPITAGNVDLAVWFRLVAEAANDADVRAALEADHRDDSKEMRRFLRRLEARGRYPEDARPRRHRRSRPHAPGGSGEPGARPAGRGRARPAREGAPRRASPLGHGDRALGNGTVERVGDPR